MSPQHWRERMRKEYGVRCPHCGHALEGLGTYCWRCHEYTETREAAPVQKLVFPLPVNIANSRMHWAERNRKKKAYWAHLDLEVYKGTIPPAPDEPVAKAEAWDHWRIWNRSDQDNLRARLKWVQDWLVTRGYLADDTADVLTFPEHPTQEIDRKRPRLELTIREAA